MPFGTPGDYERDGMEVLFEGWRSICRHWLVTHHFPIGSSDTPKVMNSTSRQNLLLPLELMNMVWNDIICSLGLSQVCKGAPQTTLALPGKVPEGVHATISAAAIEQRQPVDDVQAMTD